MKVDILRKVREPEPGYRGRRCTVDGCYRTHHARGLCALHYQQKWRRATGRIKTSIMEVFDDPNDVECYFCKCSECGDYFSMGAAASADFKFCPMCGVEVTVVIDHQGREE